MNRSSQILFISSAIDGFLQFKLAEGLCQRSVDSYQFVLKK